MALGKNISKLRKERGLTQEQLGKVLHVSAQAVSKWEKGGSPDAEMLPRIADVFKVSVDALYGRDSADARPVEDLLEAHLTSLPEDTRARALFRILCRIFPSIMFNKDSTIYELLDIASLPLKSAYTQGVRDMEGGTGSFWSRSLVLNDFCLEAGVLAEDCPVYLLMPEPENGYASFFAPDEQYLLLFQALALPESLPVLRWLYAHETASTYEQSGVFFSPDLIAKETKLPLDRIAKAMRRMHEANILVCHTLNTADGPLESYCLRENGAFLPFMLFSRWYSEPVSTFFFSWVSREQPILRDENGGTRP